MNGNGDSDRTPLVQMPNVPWSHIQLEWQYPGWRRWYERLAEKRKLIRYDSRGCGLSDREVADFSLDTHMLDLEAVVQRLGLDRFVVLGFIILRAIQRQIFDKRLAAAEEALKALHRFWSHPHIFSL